MDDVSPPGVDVLRRLQARAMREGCSVDELLDRLLHTDPTELEQKFAILDGFFNVALDLLCIADTDGNFIKVNAAWEHILGYPVEALEGRPFIDFVHPDDRAATLDALARLDRQEPVTNFTNRYRAHDGGYRYIEWRSQPHGRLIYAAARDITERKYMEDALRESERRMRVMLEAMPDMIFINRGDGTYQDYFASDIESMHVPPEHFLGKTMYDVFPPAIADHKLQMIRQALHTGQLTAYEFELDDHVFEVHVVPLGPDEAMSIARDITVRKQAQERAFDLALEQERRHLLSAFIQNAAHEFRTPLATISTSTYLMSRLDDRHHRQAKAERVQTEVERLTRLVDMLLMAARLESSDVMADGDVHIGEIMADLARFVDGCDLDFQVPDDLPPVMGNRDYLTEALKQIIDNACRFTPPESRIAIYAGAEDHRVWVRVSDSGPGIAEDDLDHIFDTFWREDRARTTPGLGLGLSIANKIIEAHGGTIQVESAPGQGSTFTVSLPGNGV